MGYVNSKNQRFRLRDAVFDTAENIHGHIARFKNRLSNPLTYTPDLENARDAEGQVFINGRLICGIFQGFRIGGGIITERVDRQRLRKEARKAKKSEIAGLKKGRTLFQIDKGLTPIRGEANFSLLDDPFSTALEKAVEFVKNVTYYEDSDEWVKLGIPRIFTIQSFLIGEDKPFNLSKIYIPRYELDMDNAQSAGRIEASFSFEQFEIIKEEKRLVKPTTERRGDDAGEEVSALTVDENPFTSEIAV